LTLREQEQIQRATVVHLEGITRSDSIVDITPQNIKGITGQERWSAFAGNDRQSLLQSWAIDRNLQFLDVPGHSSRPERIDEDECAIVCESLPGFYAAVWNCD